MRIHKNCLELSIIEKLPDELRRSDRFGVKSKRVRAGSGNSCLVAPDGCGLARCLNRSSGDEKLRDQFNSKDVQNSRSHGELDDGRMKRVMSPDLCPLLFRLGRSVINGTHDCSSILLPCPRLGLPCLARGGAFSLLFAAMAASSSDQYSGNDFAYYDYWEGGHFYKIPTEQWSRGDAPQPGQVHVDIYVSGYEYGNADHVNATIRDQYPTKRQLDGWIDVHDKVRGGFPLEDPADKKDRHAKRDAGERENIEIYGVRVTSAHDGHCEGIRWRQFHERRLEQLASLTSRAARS